jgi:hypothetical protein
MNRYRSPELPPADAIARTTAEYKRINDAHAAKLARAAGPMLAREPAPMRELDEQAENARCELIALCDTAQRYDEGAEDPALRLNFYEGFREAVREFCGALAARGSMRRSTHLDAMHAAIESLSRLLPEPTP